MSNQTGFGQQLDNWLKGSLLQPICHNVIIYDDIQETNWSKKRIKRRKEITSAVSALYSFFFFCSLWMCKYKFSRWQNYFYTARPKVKGQKLTQLPVHCINNNHQINAPSPHPHPTIFKTGAFKLLLCLQVQFSGMLWNLQPLTSKYSNTDH